MEETCCQGLLCAAARVYVAEASMPCVLDVELQCNNPEVLAYACTLQSQYVVVALSSLAVLL
jgi:hypothetical protein